MRHVSCGTLEELRNAETALIENGFKRVTSHPSAPLEYCLRDECDSTDRERRFILIWETEDEWLSQNRPSGSQRLRA
jgi:hypothetical protein